MAARNQRNTATKPEDDTDRDEDQGMGLDVPVDDPPTEETASNEAVADDPPAEETKPKYLRQGDQSRPHCPACSTKDELVLMEHYKTDPPFAYYRCPNRKTKGCRHTRSQPLPKLSDELLKRKLRRRSPPDDLSAR